MNRLHPTRAVTLIELMITIAIISIILSIAMISLSGYLPKQRLISSQGMLADILQRAQTEANARSTWTCVTFAQASAEGPVTAQITVDTNGSRTCEASPNDTPLTSMSLKSDVVLASQSGINCAKNIAPGCTIWFDTTGSPKLCHNDYTNCGSLAQASAPAGCIDWSYPIIISSTRLDAGARSRKVEALAGGLIQVVKPSDTGLRPELVTKTANASTGCE